MTMRIDLHPMRDTWRRLRTTVFRLGVSATAALAGVACASSGSAGGPDRCRSDLSPHRQSLSEVLDSAALQAGLTGLWTEDTGLVLASVQYDSLAAYDTTRVWSESLSEGSRSEIEAVVERLVPAEFGDGEPISLFLGDETGPAVRRVGRFAICPPSMKKQRDFLVRLSKKVYGLGLDRARLICTYVLVEPNGRAGDMRIHKSSGRRDTDVAVLEVLETAEFSPGTLEGMTVGVWISLPITLTPGIVQRPPPGAEEGDFWYPVEEEPAPTGSCN